MHVTERQYCACGATGCNGTITASQQHLRLCRPPPASPSGQLLHEPPPPLQSAPTPPLQRAPPPLLQRALPQEPARPHGPPQPCAPPRLHAWPAGNSTILPLRYSLASVMGAAICCPGCTCGRRATKIKDRDHARIGGHAKCLKLAPAPSLTTLLVQTELTSLVINHAALGKPEEHCTDRGFFYAPPRRRPPPRRAARPRRPPRAHAPAPPPRAPGSSCCASPPSPPSARSPPPRPPAAPPRSPPPSCLQQHGQGSVFTLGGIMPLVETW